MSFILEDNELLLKLVGGLIKKAQLAPNAVENTAKKLISKLETEYSGGNQPSNITAANTTNLLNSDLQNLSSLLKYLQNNQIKIDGNRVVYSEQEYGTIDQKLQTSYSPVGSNVGRISGGQNDRKFDAADYFTNLPLLEKYIEHLQETAKKMGPVNGKVLDVYVSKLIDQVKDIKPDTTLSRVPKSEPGQPRSIPDGITLDMFNTKSFDASKPMADHGTQFVLKSEDLKTWQSLNAWLQQPMSTVISYENGKQITKKYDDPSANKCDVINALFARSKYWASLSKNDEDTKRYAYYMKKIQELGPEFKNADGSACSVTGSVSSTSQNGAAGTPGATNVPGDSSVILQSINNMIGALPLAVENIDFHRIMDFIAEYKKILNTSKSAAKQNEVSLAINTAIQHMNAATNLTIQNKWIFSLSAQPADVAIWLKPPAADKYDSLLYHLEMVLDATGTIISNFYASYVRKASTQDREVFDNEQRSAVESQIIGGGSILSENLNNVRALEARISEVVHIK